MKLPILHKRTQVVFMPEAGNDLTFAYLCDKYAAVVSLLT